MPKKYPLTEQGKQLLIAHYGHITNRELALLLGVPIWKVGRWGQQLGLSGKKEPDWTAEEDRLLEQCYPYHSMDSLIKRLKRTRKAIKHRVLKLGVTKKSAGYTLTSLAEAMGCSRSTVSAWVARGWLRGEKRQTGRERGQDLWYFTDNAIREFVSEHPLAVAETKVDVFWLICLLTKK